MSQWFHILGSIEVEMYESSTSYNEYYLKSVIEDCPDVAGSEGGIDIFINKQSYPNGSSSHDEMMVWCGYPKYNILNRNRFSVMDPHHFPYFKTQEIQSRFVITLSGSLRDVPFDEGIRMIQKFLNRFSKMVSINNLCIQVSNDYGDRHFVIQDRECYSNNYEPDEREERINKKYEKMSEKLKNKSKN